MCTTDPGIDCTKTVLHAYDISCVEGQCSFGACETGFGDCDKEPANGCEAAINIVESCGSCGNNCSQLDNVAEAVCEVGRCGIKTCSSGFGDCDKDANTGCEKALNTPEHCGSCGNDCTRLPNVETAECKADKCSIVACKDGYADCNGVIDDGCETNVKTSFSNCNGCGSSCLFGEACSNGKCLGACPTEQLLCSGSCITSVTDTIFCGAESPCDDSPGVNCMEKMQNAYGALCNDGRCSYQICMLNFGDCDKDLSNGCETNLNTTLEHCGKCDNNCEELTQVETATCEAGSCKIETCKAGYADCDENAFNGCEQDLSALGNCGACGEECFGLEQVTKRTCKDHKCAFEACNNGFGDCDGNVSNGCETELNTPERCGSCNNNCVNLANVNTATCEGGVCKIGTCKDSYGNCDNETSNGCETSLTTTQNCFGCGKVCDANQRCSIRSKKCVR